MALVYLPMTPCDMPILERREDESGPVRVCGYNIDLVRDGRFLCPHENCPYRPKQAGERNNL